MNPIRCGKHEVKLFVVEAKFHSFHFSDVESIDKEIESGSDATISCVITGITRQLDSVLWINSDGNDVTTVSEAYSVSAGSYDSNSQTTTLTVLGASVDATFTCRITSTEWLQTDLDTSVDLNVFGMYISCLLYTSPSPRD